MNEKGKKPLPITKGMYVFVSGVFQSFSMGFRKNIGKLNG